MFAPSQIERLEARIAPAAVTATVSRGVLEINTDGTNDARGFSLRQTAPNSFDLDTGSDNEPLHFSGVRAIRGELAETEDHVSIILTETGFRGSVRLDTNTGHDFIAIGGGPLDGDFTVLSEGAGAIDIANISILGKVRIASAGMGTEIYASLGSSVRIRGFDDVYFGDIDIEGPVQIIASAGVGTDVGTSIAHFHSDLTIIGSALHDSFFLRGQVDGDLKVHLGEGDNSFIVGNPSFTQETIIAGSLSFKGGNGEDRMTLNPDVNVHRNVEVDAGNGNNFFEFLSPGDTGRLLYIGGKGSDTFTLGSNGGAALKGVVLLGAGSDEAIVPNIHVLELRIDGGSQPKEEGEDRLRISKQTSGLIHRGFEAVFLVT